MKICLINPPNIFEKENGYIWSANIYTLPYLGIGYIASYLKQNNIDVDIIDCPVEDADIHAVYRRLELGQYQAVGISVFYYNLHFAMKIVRHIKKQNNNTFVFVGGFLPTLDYETLLLKINWPIDCCVIGWGEFVSLELMQAIENKAEWRNIAGIAYRQEGQAIRNKNICHNDLDIIPNPIRTCGKYPINFVSILTSRGCFGNCNFCGEKEFSIANGTSGIIYRSVDSVIDEILCLKQQYSFHHLRINDSNFLDASKKRRSWLIRFCEMLNQKNIDITFSCNSRAKDIITQKDILNILKDVGMTSVFIGIESFSQRQLDSYSKNTQVQDNLECLKILSGNGIKAEIGLIFIDPYTSIDEFILNIDTLLNSSFLSILDVTQHFVSSACTLFLIPGTRLETQIKNDKVNCKNALGYQFADERINLVQEILEEWSEKIKPITSLKYVLFKAIAQKNQKLIAQYYDWFKNIFEEDIHFIKRVAEGIKNGNINRKNYKSLLDAETDAIFNMHEKYFEG